MYAQSPAVHWTQEYDQEEGLYTKVNYNALLCLTLRNNSNSKLLDLIQINLQSLTRKSKNSALKIKKPSFLGFLGFFKT